jgi:hypothetical protein
VLLTLATSAPVLAGSIAGFTPLAVLGTIYDFGVPLYALVTGRDLAGTEVSTGQIVLMGVFALVGAALDYGPEFFKLATSLMDKLIPAAERVAVEAALNPELAANLLRRTSPMLAEAAGAISEPDAGRLVKAMESAVSASAAALRELARVVTEVLVPMVCRHRRVA